MRKGAAVWCLQASVNTFFFFFLYPALVPQTKRGLKASTQAALSTLSSRVKKLNKKREHTVCTETQLGATQRPSCSYGWIRGKKTRNQGWGGVCAATTSWSLLTAYMKVTRSGTLSGHVIVAAEEVPDGRTGEIIVFGSLWSKWDREVNISAARRWLYQLLHPARAKHTGCHFESLCMSPVRRI